METDASMASGASSRPSSAYRLFPVVDANPPPSPTIPFTANFLKSTESSRNRSTSLNTPARPLYSSASNVSLRDPSKFSDLVGLPELRPMRTLPDLGNPSFSYPRPQPGDSSMNASSRRDDRRYSKYLPGGLQDMCRFQSSDSPSQDRQPSPLTAPPATWSVSVEPEADRYTNGINELDFDLPANCCDGTLPHSSRSSSSSVQSDVNLLVSCTPDEMTRSGPFTNVALQEFNLALPARTTPAPIVCTVNANSLPPTEASKPQPATNVIAPEVLINKPLPPIEPSQTENKIFLPRPDSSAIPATISTAKYLLGLPLPGEEDDLPPTPPPKDECCNQGDPQEHFSHDLFVSPQHPAQTCDVAIVSKSDVGSLPPIPEPKSKYSEVFDHSSADGHLPPSARPSRSSSKASLLNQQPFDHKASQQQASPTSDTYRTGEKFILAPAANIKGPRSSNSSNESFHCSEPSRSSTPDLSTATRVTTPALLSRQTSNSSPIIDPLQIIQDLAAQSEALNIRYATLKADRLKLSGKIIETLRQPSKNWDMSKLMDEQLSLAAISSSMDICFAKLRSVECRREDAIAALLAQLSQKPRKLHSSRPPHAGQTTPGSLKSLQSPPCSASTPNFHFGRAQRLHKYQGSNDSMSRDYASASRRWGLSSSNSDLKPPGHYDNISVNGSSSDLLDALDSVDLSEYMDSDVETDSVMRHDLSNKCHVIQESPSETSAKAPTPEISNKAVLERSIARSRPAPDQRSIKSPSVTRGKGFQASKLLRLFSSGKSSSTSKSSESQGDDSSSTRQPSFDFDAMSASISDAYDRDAAPAAKPAYSHARSARPVNPTPPRSTDSSPTTYSAQSSSLSISSSTPPQPKRMPPTPPVLLPPHPIASATGPHSTANKPTAPSFTTADAGKQSACSSLLGSASMLSMQSGNSSEYSFDENKMTPKPRAHNRSSTCSFGASQRLQVFLGYDEHDQFHDF